MNRLLPTACPLVLAAAALHAGPLDLSTVPADVRLVMHLDAEAFRATELGKLVQERAERDWAKQIEEVARTAGFDIRSDFSGFTMYADGAAREGGQGALIVEGVFDADKLLSMAAEYSGYESRAYGEETVHSWIDNGRRTHGYMSRDGKRIAFSDSRKQIERAIDTLLGRNKSLAEGNPNRLPLPQAGDAAGYMFAGAADFRGMKGLRAQAAILKQARTLRFDLSENDGQFRGVLALQAVDEDTAVTMLELIDGLLSFGRAAGEKDPLLARLLAGLDTKQEGEHVRATFVHSTADLKNILDEAERKRQNRGE